MDEVLPVLQGVARGCQVQDRAFWPQKLFCAVPHVSAASTEPREASTVPEDDDEALGMLGVLDRYAVLGRESGLTERHRRRVREPLYKVLSWENRHGGQAFA